MDYTPEHLRRLANDGKIDIIQYSAPPLLKGGGHRRYDIDGYIKSKSNSITTVCYCRVSSPKPRDALERQVEYMRSIYPEAEVIRDIGSGLNFKRKGLKTLLERLLLGDKLQVVIAHRARLARFSYSATTQKREPSGRVVALDPGVRTFLTYFHERGFGWLGHHAINKIQRLCSYLDNLLSRAAKAKRPQRRNMRNAAKRICRRIRNLIDELHKKIARWFVDTFDIILLPTFETSHKTCKSGRKLHKRTARQMLTLSHYRFKQFLKHKAKETGCLVVDVNEAYTSKTVSWTGEIVKNLGGAKVIKDSTGLKMDRDLNGARGIFLRALVDEPWLLYRSNLQTV